MYRRAASSLDEPARSGRERGWGSEALDIEAEVEALLGAGDCGVGRNPPENGDSGAVIAKLLATCLTCACLSLTSSDDVDVARLEQRCKADIKALPLFYPSWNDKESEHTVVSRKEKKSTHNSMNL